MIADQARRGLFGHGSILTSTSNANRTSPTVRGKWILANLIGMPPSPPPAVVPPLKENPDGATPANIRAQMEEHRTNAVCASCHKLMDPLGFAMENFDAVGSWRMREHGSPIDASGQFLDGAKLNGVEGLRQVLVSHPDIFVGTLTEKLLTYALGRGLDYFDMPAVRKIVRESASRNYRFSTLVVGIVNSGITTPHHTISHHGGKADALKAHATLNTYHVSLFAKFVEKLHNTPDGDGSLLDHSLLFYGSGMSNANVHGPYPLPLVTVGGGVGKGHRHVVAPEHTPLGNLWVTVAEMYGVEGQTFGESTGRVEL